MNSNYVQTKQFQEKARQRRRRGLVRRLTAFAIIALVMSGVFLSIFTSQAATLNEKLDEKQKAQAELKEMQKKEKMLKEEIQQLNNMEYIGEIARRDYFMSKPGETIFKLPSN
ncbi:septum formation initiator family protein [Pseudalkalibacillus caeni]|uniref:Septum formation initiator family protein n=2 Tax=Exobacillus caeni TaxID=2574798 RepID=A0A5R9EY85_9BACL|nr:septum formation initiator family protein [Pseudalkalibacillus caeni]